MLTEETNKELKTAPANPEAEIANEESAPEETWQRKLARGIPFGFPDSAAAAETGGEPAGTRA